MKKLFLSLFSLLAVALLTPSCTNEKEVNPADATAEVSFEVNLLGNPNEETKAYTNDLGKCATQEELQDLAAAGKLMLHFTIGTTTHDVKIIWNGSKFISAPLLLSAGTYSVSAATVTDGSGTLLFSGVANSSPYASYVPELLPKTFTIGTEAGNIPLYQKSILDLYMLCVLNETPEKFGFVKWNIHFSKLYCVPFIINKCANTGEDFVATGTITVKNGTYDEKTFTPATGKESPKWAVVNKTDNFPTTNGVGYLCFADNYDIDNTIEYYQITLNITSPTSVAETIVGYASVATLLQYNNAGINNAWNATQNTIHLDFCNCKTWFFPCVKPEPVCETCDDVSLVIYKDSEQATINSLRNFFKYSTDNGATWITGLDATTFPIAPGLTSILIPAGYLLETIQPIKPWNWGFQPSPDDNNILYTQNGNKFWVNNIKSSFLDRNNQIVYPTSCCCYFARIKTLSKCYLGTFWGRCDM